LLSSIYTAAHAATIKPVAFALGEVNGAFPSRTTMESRNSNILPVGGIVPLSQPAILVSVCMRY
jgi:hypothetical protein